MRPECSEAGEISRKGRVTTMTDLTWMLFYWALVQFFLLRLFLGL